MASALSVVKAAYDAFGRGDVAAILALVTEWIHVFTVHGGKITRWRGCYDTAARFL
ncbi:hypothetical protein CBM2589_B180136 [Cupriavidus taiwanensis]|uniref:SnoaL-like domain-containing protein n=1 Tax=Cupriavidus taiwanensis TaxID=164546 RepID=A0A975ZZE7_9BURK|nr:hypothetical protein [Cupriavidus taiwanensis]SOY47382.1 hypothetical protein CBM2589_B180136 [Cupriavidus taiwanensis]